MGSGHQSLRSRQTPGSALTSPCGPRPPMLLLVPLRYRTTGTVIIATVTTLVVFLIRKIIVSTVTVACISVPFIILLLWCSPPRLCANLPKRGELSSGTFAPRRPLTVAGDIFGCHSWMGGYGHYHVETRDAAGRPIGQPPTRNDLAQSADRVLACGVILG